MATEGWRPGLGLAGRGPGTEWTVRLEAKTGRSAAESIALVAITRPAVATAAEEVGLGLAEAKALLAGLQANVVRTQPAGHVALGRICPEGRVAPRTEDRRPRRLQTLFGTVEAEAARFKACPCGGGAGRPGTTGSPVCDLLQGARCTPELERVHGRGAPACQPRRRS